MTVKNIILLCSFFFFLLPPKFSLVFRYSLYPFPPYQNYCSSSQYTDKQQNKYCRLNPYPRINIFYFFCITGIACTFFYNWSVPHASFCRYPFSEFMLCLRYFLCFHCLTTINASLYPSSFTGSCRCFLFKPFIFLFMLQFGYLFFFAHLFTYGTIFFSLPLCVTGGFRFYFPVTRRVFQSL